MSFSDDDALIITHFYAKDLIPHTGRSKETINNTLKELEAEGWIVRLCWNISVNWQIVVLMDRPGGPALAPGRRGRRCER